MVTDCLVIIVIGHLAAAPLWHQITIWTSHEKKPKTIFYTTGSRSGAPVSSQQQLHPRPSVEQVEATWGLFYHLAAQTHTWHTCQRGLSQGTDPVGVGRLPLETRQNGSSVLHGQLKREERRWGVGCERRRRMKIKEKENKNRWEGEKDKCKKWNKRNWGEESRWFRRFREKFEGERRRREKRL